MLEINEFTSTSVYAEVEVESLPVWAVAINCGTQIENLFGDAIVDTSSFLGKKFYPVRPGSGTKYIVSFSINGKMQDDDRQELEKIVRKLQGY